MRLFRAIGIIIFLVAAKTFLLATPYNDFETTLSQFFQTSTTGLTKIDEFLQNIDTSKQIGVSNLVATPTIDFSYQSN